MLTKNLSRLIPVIISDSVGLSDENVVYFDSLFSMVISPTILCSNTKLGFQKTNSAIVRTDI